MTPSSPARDGVASPEEGVRRMVEHTAHLLPAQGPIRVFVHHNTLHAFEALPFEEAVVRAGERFGCRPFLEEEDYRREWLQGRILTEDLRSVLLEDLGGRSGEIVLGTTTRLDLRLALLAGGLQEPDEKGLDWHLNESDEPMDRALWEACRKAVGPLGPVSLPEKKRARYRDKLLASTGEDTDSLIHPLLIRFCAAFCDQGIAYWRLPSRSLGFLGSFLRTYENAPLPDAWLQGLSGRLKGRKEAASSIIHSLRNLEIPPEEWEAYIEEMMLALRGWPGMLRQIEERPDRVLIPSPPGTLLEYAAVRLLLEEQAVAYVTSHHHLRLPDLRGMLAKEVFKTIGMRAYSLYQAAQLLDWSVEAVQATPAGPLLDEIEAFSSLERRRLFHLAYERRHRNRTLDALLSQPRFSPSPLRGEGRGEGDFAKLHTPHPIPLPQGEREAANLGLPSQYVKRVTSLSFQAVGCIDEREESFRRHLEETEPSCETFGTAGFFGLAIYYRGVEDAHSVPLCPILVKPTHSVRELPVEDAPPTYSKTQKEGGAWPTSPFNSRFLQGKWAESSSFREAFGRTAYALHVGSRTGVRGAIFSGLFGTLAALPLVFRVFFPRHAAKFDSRLRSTSSKTRLEWNYTPQEQARVVGNLLEETGLKDRLSRLVVIVGHGSSSLNNPHESAHDCGACGGGRGGPNARIFALMANNPEVRESLGIPPETVFVGAYHNTCNDLIEYYDLDRVPASHAADLALAQEALDKAAALSAQERSRRFDNIPSTVSPLEALKAMADRTEDLAQVRPEYGHATNAVAVVGRRSLTRGLFMDRRAFLASYDPTVDADGALLTRVLSAVGPVCAGINLEYYFSFTDRAGYGCGTKLPHNITDMLGVMDGHASDLRTGLPWQMVEIHEPVRLLLVVESPVSRLEQALSRLPAVDRLVKNRWIQLAALDSETKRIYLFKRSRFEPYEPENLTLPQAPSSAAWHQGRRGHLDYARIVH